MKETEKKKLRTMYHHYHGRCFLCNSMASQRAHLIGQTKSNYARYGKEVIDSIYNWLPACDLYHNGLMDVGKNRTVLDNLAELIKAGDRETIEDIVRDNVARKQNKL